MTTAKAPNPKADRTGRNRVRRTVMTLGAVGLAAAYVASGFYFVQPDERAVVRRWGRVVEPQASPGLHQAWPRPIGRVDKVPTAVRAVTIGLSPEARTAIAAGDLVAQGESAQTDVFTGDTNIIKATLVATYRVTEVANYLVRASDPDHLVANAVQSAMIEALGGYSIDDALTEGKAQIQNATREHAQAMLNMHDCGVTLIQVNLESIEPPFAINDAFRDVASAKKDRERVVDQAEAFANDLLPKARARAYEMEAAARSYSQKRIQQARGETHRFQALRSEYVRAPSVTRTRLLLSTLATVLDRAETYVVTPNDEGPPLRITIGDGPDP